MKNRSCPNRYGCWDYNANNCEDCPIGKLIEKQKRKIARLTEENERLKEKVKELDIVEKTTYRVLFRLMKITFLEHGIDDNEVHERIKELLREAEREILREAQEERK